MKDNRTHLANMRNYRDKSIVGSLDLVMGCYQDFVCDNDFSNPDIPKERLFLAAMGLSGEAGEVSEVWKKHLLHGKELDRDKVIDEMGDVFWYFMLMMDNLDITLEDVILGNVKKLTERYG